MAARNRCSAEADALRSEATAGVTPPLLPTLVVAVVLAAASFYCEVPATHPTTPAPALAVRMSAATLSPAAEAPVVTPFVPAALTFPLQFPIVVAAHAEGATRQIALQVPPHRPAGPRIATVRRPVPTKIAPADSAVVGSAAVEPVSIDASAGPETDEGVLPSLALPFAPTIRAATRAATFVGVQSAAVGAEAASLGEAMAGIVNRLH
ncbi:hypothetical protein G3T14_14735 [Methylobacterium sp. BTF04]|uniref:hypothetical protein n=1 Tax=Methylobacterium sp. BTF04 TaxID=2708300 RepID=UPI0013D841A3|nr:hypothetical protein [Methylobacterium sp. BTF04]NEU13377.1 hypothetical protein [Methylobacterium sp. BTF04]